MTGTGDAARTVLKRPERVVGNTGSIARRVVVLGVGALAAALLAVGLFTAMVVHLREVAALDRALISAAHARARPEGPGQWQVAALHPPYVETWIASPDDQRVPYRLRERVAERGAPLLKDKGKDRMLLLPVTIEGGARVVVTALAPRVTPTRSVGAFTIVWLAASAVVIVTAAVTMHGAVQLAFRPLQRAVESVSHVVALGQGQRVETTAPQEVRPLLVAINALLDRLDRAHALQVRFTAEAAHELRTPVTALLGQLDVALRRERSAESHREDLALAREEVGRLRRLVEALTALARVDAGEIEAHRELVRAGDIAHTALENEGAQLADAGCKVTLHLDEDPELEAHRVLLELALGNLLRNAARHAPGSEVTLTVRCEGGRTLFEVRDTGPGLSPELWGGPELPDSRLPDKRALLEMWDPERPNEHALVEMRDPSRSLGPNDWDMARAHPGALGEAAFERFTRGVKARSADPHGLGLGLPLAREVARRHGGDCTLFSLPGGGTRAVLAVRTP